MSIPVPFQYQGSKRKLAPEIAKFFPASFSRLVEPFCGTGALSIYTASIRPDCTFWLNDINEDLIRTLELCIENPADLAEKYKSIWNGQFNSNTTPIRYFYDQRDLYNEQHQPEQFLFMMARIVKGSVRYNPAGQLNQGCDNRRYGTTPERMRKNLQRISQLLKGKTICTSMDYKDVLNDVTPDDLVYLDPPYQGTSQSKNPRYLSGIDRSDFIYSLCELNKKNIPYILSYDGHNSKFYGKDLPEFLNLKKIEIPAGRSSQHTLLGESVDTTEVLYLSCALCRLCKIDLDLAV